MVKAYVLLKDYLTHNHNVYNGPSVDAKLIGGTYHTAKRAFQDLIDRGVVKNRLGSDTPICIGSDIEFTISSEVQDVDLELWGTAIRKMRNDSHKSKNKISLSAIDKDESKKTKNKNDNKLSQEELVVQINKTMKSMWTYLNYGRTPFDDGFPAQGRREDMGDYSPIASSWLNSEILDKSGTLIGFDPSEWSHTNFVSYYWFLACKWKVGKFPHANLTCPFFVKNSRLNVTIKSLLSQMGKRSTLLYIQVLCNHFDLIKYRIGKFADGMHLDDTLPCHATVKSQVDDILTWDNEKLNEEYGVYLEKQG